MKNLLLFLFLFGLSALLFTACGETKEEPVVDEETTIEDEMEPGDEEEPKEEVPEGWAALEAPMIGKVACLHKIMTDGNGETTPEDAQMCASKGDPVGLMVNGVFYFVFKDNASADAELASLADKPGVQVDGYMKVQNGMNVLMAKEIKPVEQIQ